MSDTLEKIHVVEDELSAIDYCYEQGWTDGLPVIPPSEERVEQMLASTARGREAILATHPATGRECSVFSAAVNAVMAGCRPEYFPIAMAALEAMNESPYHFHGSSASTGGSAPLLIVSGPIVERIGMNSGVNVFGPGNRANATIGRAIRLVILNVFKMTPGIADRSTGSAVADSNDNAGRRGGHGRFMFDKGHLGPGVAVVGDRYNLDARYFGD